MVYALFFLSAAFNVASSAFLRTYRGKIYDDTVKDSVHYFVLIVVSLLYYAAISGFSLGINGVTALYSLIYAVIAYFSVYMNMRALENAEFVTISLFSNAGSVIWGTLWGKVLFSEELTRNICIGIALVLASILIQYLSGKKNKSNMKGLICCLIIFLISGMGNALLKCYATTPDVMPESVFCFYTNLFMIPFVLLMLRKRTTLKAALKSMGSVKRGIVLLSVISVVLSSTGNYISILVLKKIDLMIYALTAQPLSLVMTLVVGWIVFGEKITYSKAVSILLSIAAIILVTI